MKQRNARDICPGDIISASKFVGGYRVKGTRNVMVAAVYRGDIKDYIGAYDLTREESQFLVLSTHKSPGRLQVRAVRLGEDLDYEHSSERILFYLSRRKTGLQSVNFHGVACTDSSIQVGDVIQSDRFGDKHILKHQDRRRGKGKPNPADSFEVLSLSMQGGGVCHTRHDTFADGKYVTAVRLSKDNMRDLKSSRVEFYISGDFAREVRINSVRLVGRVSRSCTTVEIAKS